MGVSGETIRHSLSSTWRKVWRRKVIEKDIMETKLDRCMSTFDLILLGIGHMVGSGIYVITGTVMLNDAGPSTVLSYLFAGIIALLIAICYAQLSVNIPRVGTCYSYVYIIAGELIAFLAGWNLMLEYIISVASVARSFSTYLDGIAGGAIRNLTMDIVGHSNSDFVNNIDFIGPLAIFLVFIIVGVGMKTTAVMNNIMVVLNVTVILVIIGAGISIGNISNLTEGPGGFFPYGFPGTVTGTGVVFYAYLGFDAIATAAEETKNPGKALPVAFSVALGITTVLYCMASFSLSLLVPYDEVDIGAPFPIAFTGYGVIWVKYVVSIGATIGLTCSLLGQSYCLPRYLYALACDGLLFSQLTYVNSWTKTPLISVIISALLAAILAMVLPIKELVEMVSGGALFSMSMMLICLLKLHYMPAKECPFELIQPVMNTLNSSEKNEDTPILKSEKDNNLERIGTLRYQVPLLRKFKSSRVIFVALTTICSSLVVLTSCVFVGKVSLAQGQWWIITLIVISGTVFISSFCMLLLYEHNTSFAKFKVPLFPWIPVLALAIVLCLMMSLSSTTWMRISIWMAIGVVMYFIYGIRYSIVNRSTDYTELENEKKMQEASSTQVDTTTENSTTEKD